VKVAEYSQTLYFQSTTDYVSSTISNVFFGNSISNFCVFTATFFSEKAFAGGSNNKYSRGRFSTNEIFNPSTAGDG